MAPQTQTRYRVQQLIRKGEWLERNWDFLLSLIDSIDELHDQLLELEDMEQAAYVGGRMMSPIKALNQLACEMRFRTMLDDVERGRDVTIKQPYAAGSKYEVVIKAPVADVPSQEEFNRVRAEVDITN